MLLNGGLFMTIAFDSDLISDICVYNYALSESEIAAIYDEIQ